MPEATMEETSWWDDLGEMLNAVASEVAEAAKSVWDSFKESFIDMKNKFVALFQKRELDENGRPVGEGFWGRSLAAVLSILSFAGKVIVGMASIALVAAIGYYVMKNLATIIVSILAIILVVFAGILLYKVIKGVGLAFATPNVAYFDRTASDDNWTLYWSSWKPKYWLCASVNDMPKWDEFWDQAAEAYIDYVSTMWAEEESAWAKATA